MAPDPIWLVSFLKGEIWTQTDTHTLGERHVEGKTEIGVMELQAKDPKDCQQTSESTGVGGA